MHTFLLENRAMWMRWYARFRRDLFSLVATLLQPVLWLVLFGSSLQNMVRGTVPGGDYLAFMTAAAFVMTVFNGGLNGGLELMYDRESGFFDRLLATPMRRLSLVTGRFSFVLAITVAQGLLIISAAYLMGVRYATGLWGIALTLLVGALFGASITTVSIILAFVLRNHGQFFSLIAIVSLPLLFLSSALAPLEAMPAWLAAVARLNPLTHAIEAVRTLVIVGWDVRVLLEMSALLIGVDVLLLLVAARVLRRSLA